MSLPEAGGRVVHRDLTMNRVVVVSFLALFLSCGVAFGQSLEKAKLLYSNKLYEDAKRELVAIAAGSGAAAALAVP